MNLRVSVVGAIVAFAAVSGFGQIGPPCGAVEREPTGTAEDHSVTNELGSDEYKGLIIRQDEILSDMRALDTYLQALISKMNAARGGEKANAMADVVNELVWQRTQIYEEMMSLQRDMMRYFAGHQRGVTNALEPVEDCPMTGTMMRDVEPERSDPGESGHH